MPVTWRRCCFTRNNYSEDDVAVLNVLATRQGTVCLIYGKEVGASGTPHLQGYIECRGTRTLTAWKKLLPDGSHVEPANGSRAQNFTYCSKDGDYIIVPNEFNFWTKSTAAAPGAYSEAMETVHQVCVLFFSPFCVFTCVCVCAPLGLSPSVRSSFLLLLYLIFLLGNGLPIYV